MRADVLFPVLLATALGCNRASEAFDVCPDLPDPQGDDVVTTTLPIALFAGQDELRLGETVRTETGIPYEVHKLRMYVSEVELVRADGGREAALLVDGSDAPLAYGVQMVDAADLSSLRLNLRAPAGTYVGLDLTIGVPPTCPDGETELNHADASEMSPPLDVDSDMYWSWKPGYTFFKVEGRSGATSESFFYHVGDDERLVHVAIEGELVVADGESPSTLAVDVNRVFVTPDGDALPKIDGDRKDREVHSGDLATQVQHNLEGSHFLELI